MAGALLEPVHAERRKKVGLLDDDLKWIRDKGREAADLDRRQRVELAGQKQGMTERLENRDRVDEEAEGLRNRIPAVILNLAADPTTKALAGWLQAAAFDRLRVRIVPASGETGATADATRDVVDRRDRLSIAQSISQFVQSLLEPERAPIVDALARRDMGRERLEALSADAQALVEALGGKEVLTPADATRAEAAAVAAQKERWDACRRMIRAAVQGNDALQKLWTAC